MCERVSFFHFFNMNFGVCVYASAIMFFFPHQLSFFPPTTTTTTKGKKKPPVFKHKGGSLDAEAVFPFLVVSMDVLFALS